MSQDRTPTTPLRKHWTKIAQQALLGKTITGIEYANKATLAKLDMDFDGESILLFTFNDGTTWTVACDDEFNGPGAFHLLLHPAAMNPVTECLPTVPADE